MLFPFLNPRVLESNDEVCDVETVGDGKENPLLNNFHYTM